MSAMALAAGPSSVAFTSQTCVIWELGEWAQLLGRLFPRPRMPTTQRLTRSLAAALAGERWSRVNVAAPAAAAADVRTKRRRLIRDIGTSQCAWGPDVRFSDRLQTAGFGVQTWGNRN